ncbi:endospore germination permease [Clostridiaceae bacterium 35-E11]
MLKNQKITSRQFWILVILCFVGTTIIIGPGSITAKAKQDAWMAVILSTGLGLLLVSLYNAWSNLFPTMTLIECIEKIFGKWLGKIIGLWFIFFLFSNCATLVWILGNFVTTQIMPETPIQFTNILFVSVVVIATRLGLETFSRAAEILFPWVIGLFIVLTVFAIKDVELENLLPLFECGTRPILGGTLVFSTYSSLTMVALLMIFPACVNDLTASKKSFFSATAISGIMILTVTILNISVLGHDLTSRNEFPVYVLAKKISIGDFLQRIEILIAILWFITIFYKTLLFFYGAALGLAQTLGLENYRPITLPLGMILVVLSLVVYPSTTYANEWTTTTWIPFILTNGLFLPLLLLVVGKLQK